RDSEDVHVPKGLKVRRLHKAFLRYHDPNNWPMLRAALKRMGREDLIGNGKHQLVPRYQPPGTGKSPAGRRVAEHTPSPAPPPPPVTAGASAAAIRARLRGLANPPIAARSARFFKSRSGEYGAGDRFLGVRVPEVRRVAREFRAGPVGAALALLRSPLHEE